MRQLIWAPLKLLLYLFFAIDKVAATKEALCHTMNIALTEHVEARAIIIITIQAAATATATNIVTVMSTKILLMKF